MVQGCFLGDLIFTSIQSSLSVVIGIIGPGVSANHASSNLTLTGWWYSGAYSNQGLSSADACCVYCHNQQCHKTAYLAIKELWKAPPTRQLIPLPGLYLNIITIIILKGQVGN